MPQNFPAPSQKLLNDLKAVVGTKGWVPADEAEHYLEDPRGRFSGQVSIVLKPANTDEVSDIVKLCNVHRAGIVTFGGGTGVVAGQISPDSQNAILVSLEKLNKVRNFYPSDAALTVEAGCILENIHGEAQNHGLQFPLSMASKGSCTIGGNLATNAGGIRVVRYGNARDLCLGIEAVLPNGDILSELTPLRKNNTGYDLRHLLIGSEGTLGIITAATLALAPVDPVTQTAFLAVQSPQQAMSVYQNLRGSIGQNLSALELMSGFGINLVTTHFAKLKQPFGEPHAWYLLVEASGGHGFDTAFQDALEHCFDLGLVHDAVIAQSEAQSDGLWDLREYTPEANKAEGAVCNSDTSVPLGSIPAFIQDTHKAIYAINSELRINSYGHLGDGNIHHNVFPPLGISKSEFTAQYPDIIEEIRMAINDATVKHEGSISAEHGIGRLKTKDLASYAAAEKLNALRAIKMALDPNNILNPGAILPIR